MFRERYGENPRKDDLTILVPRQDDPTEQVRLQSYARTRSHAHTHTHTHTHTYTHTLRHASCHARHAHLGTHTFA